MKISDILKATGLSQVAFARELGIPRRTLQDWVQEKRKPPEYVVKLIMEHYRINNKNLDDTI